MAAAMSAIEKPTLEACSAVPVSATAPPSACTARS